MAEHSIDLNNWARLSHFNLFRTYQKPHYAVTSRVNISALMKNAKSRKTSTYRACLYAIGAGIHVVPELMTRFRGNSVVRHDSVALSMTVPRTDGAYGYAYVPYVEGFEAFDEKCAEIIEQAASGAVLDANTGQRDDLIYLSCLPWFDFTSFTNALPGPDDCIPRVSWGKFVDHGDRWDMAMAIEVHHALVDGEHLGAFFETVQKTLDDI